MRSYVWLIATISSIWICLVYGQLVRNFDTPSYGRIGLFALLWLLGMAMVFLSGPVHSWHKILRTIWIPAILMRLALLPAAPSDDINRYLWEGKLITQGMLPYTDTADAELWRAHRDSYWEAMNHKDKRTAYPPLSQWAFAAIAALWYHPLAFKLIFVLADILTIGGILVRLRQCGMAYAYAGFYAFNPVVLLAFAVEGHFDSLMTAALVWGLVAYGSHRFYWAMIPAALAAGIKWVSLPLILFFIGAGSGINAAVRKEGWRCYALRGFIGAGVLLLPAVYFRDALPQLFQGLLHFGGTQNFNGPIYGSLLASGIPGFVLTPMLGIAWGGVILWRWVLRKRSGIEGHLIWIMGALLVLSPTVHFWYLTWILPLVCLRPGLPWLVVSLTGGVYFYVWIIKAVSGEWGWTFWQQLIFWGPFWIACLYELWSTRAGLLFPQAYRPSTQNSIAVIIPTLNAADQLPGALKSLALQTRPPLEIIVVDAGSDDGTSEVLKSSELPFKIIESTRGRGLQISRGIEAAKADWVVVLHADAELNPDSLERLHSAVKNRPEVIGGAFGQRFNRDEFKYTVIEVLNDLRALFFRTAFGDQTQFFHRETALKMQLMPKQPLMEDVESSWRTRVCGGFIFLGQANRVSCLKWTRNNWLQRCTLIIRWLIRYRVARSKGPLAAEALSAEIYREYYGTKR